MMWGSIPDPCINYLAILANTCTSMLSMILASYPIHYLLLCILMIPDAAHTASNIVQHTSSIVMH